MAMPSLSSRAITRCLAFSGLAARMVRFASAVSASNCSRTISLSRYDISFSASGPPASSSPFVGTYTFLISGRPCRKSTKSRKRGCIVASPPVSCTESSAPFCSISRSIERRNSSSGT
jgi:hypothetical protein